MATITPALAGVSPVSLYGEMAVASFTLPAVGDNSAALEYAEFADRSVQVTTANWGGSTLVLQGSNDGLTWFTLTDPQGNPLSFTANALEQITEATRYIRASVSGGTGTNFKVDIFLRRGRVST